MINLSNNRKQERKKKLKELKKVKKNPNTDNPVNDPIWYGSPPNHYKYPKAWVMADANKVSSISDSKINNNEIIEDKTLKCHDCLKPFTFVVGEQKFFKDNGLDTPKRCKDCRNKNKAKKLKHRIKPIKYRFYRRL